MRHLRYFLCWVACAVVGHDVDGIPHAEQCDFPGHRDFPTDLFCRRCEVWL